MASDLIERLRAATMGFDWSDLPDDACIPAVPLLREAATALAIERERAEKAEREHGAAVARFRASEADAELWQIQVERAEASLAEAKRLLKPIAALAYEAEIYSYSPIHVEHTRAAARFLAQEEGRPTEEPQR